MATDTRQAEQAFLVQSEKPCVAASPGRYATDEVMDSAGRVLIPPTLRSYAALDKHVMLIGQGNKFELWDEAKWQAQQQVALSFMDGDLPPELEGSRCE